MPPADASAWLGRRPMPMQRICFTLQVRPDRLTEYRDRHRAVWPEMLEALRSAGWANYSLFLRPDGMLIGYLESEDFGAALRAMEATEVNARWQTEMAEFIELPEGGRPDTSMEPLEEVFHLD
jgi:L-rhamnose mutarotase